MCKRPLSNANGSTTTKMRAALQCHELLFIHVSGSRDDVEAMNAGVCPVLYFEHTRIHNFSFICISTLFFQCGTFCVLLGFICVSMLFVFFMFCIILWCPYDRVETDLCTTGYIHECYEVATNNDTHAVWAQT